MRPFTRRQLLVGSSVVAAASALAACGVAPTPQVVTETVVVKETVIVEGPTAVPGAATFVLEMYVPFNEDYAIYTENEITPKLQASFPNATVYFRPLDWSRIQEVLLSSKAAGAMPDLFTMGASFVPIAAENQLSEVLDERLDQWGEREDFYPSALAVCQWQGKTWGLPQQTGARAYSYRRDLSDEGGAEIPADWTWDDYLDVAVRLTVYDGNKIARMGSVCYMDTQEWMGVVMSAGTTPKGSILKGGKAAFNSEGGLWALNWIKTRNNSIAPEGYAPLPQSPIPYVATGQVVIGYGEGGSVATDVGRYAPDKLQYMVLQQPPLKSQRIALSNTDWLAMSVTSKQKDAAWELLKLHMSPEALIRWNESMGLIPPRASAADQAEYLKRPDMVQAAAVLANQSVPFSMVPSWAEWDAIITPLIESTVLGRKTAEEALAEAETQVNELFANRPDWPDM